MLEDLPSAPKISEEISHFAGLLKRAVSQTHRRVFEGEQVSAVEKLLSIFEEHTAIIRRGKARKQTEFGRKVGLAPNERTISAYATIASSIVACSYSYG